jgi:2-oxoglutarate dehydrogenase E1 component
MAIPMADLLELAGNLPFVDEVYERYRTDPSSVDASWRHLFESGVPAPTPTNGVQRHQAPQAVALPVPRDRDARVFGLVNNYRVRGHLEAQIDPLGHMKREPHPGLDPHAWGLTDAEMEQVFGSGGLFGVSEAPLREILRRLRETYCGSIGVEMMHMVDVDRRIWLQQRMEPTLNKPPLDHATSVFILERMAAAELFEHFVHTKYVGTKRFSLEGAEMLIPLLDLVLEAAGAHAVDEAVIGMAHRGRLNVLRHTMGKAASDIFAEFEDIDAETMFGGGDVKYHLGFSSDRTLRNGSKMHLSLAFNPSHLEAVDPVVVGRVRAKQRRRADAKHERVLGILIHGDAAFAGQGLVPETLNLSGLHGYRTGGTVHVVVNNQIGFTTLPAESRSTHYATDVAKAIMVPIFHVNGEDPVAVAQVVNLAMEYRRTFGSDVVIDLICYRKYGHNEADEPAFTQPLMYQKIEARPTPRQMVEQKYIREGVITAVEADDIVKKQMAFLESEYTNKPKARPKVSAGSGYWQGYVGGPDAKVPDVDTGVPADKLHQLTQAITELPEGFRANSKITRLLAQRRQMGLGEAPIDWGMGEHLAFASLVDEGRLVRLSGQDSQRGTFSHRHAVVVDQRTELEYVPLEHVRPGQGRFRVYNSPLSEAGVLGFEYGYSLDYPDGLVIWEAQFGDFVNGAQVIIDQFISSAEDKWKRLAGLVMLLPHGYEGQGPEHSSARLERFFELCGEDNMQVAYPTTPANYFHLLRRQVNRPWRKPLVVMTPKSMLRLPAARSQLEELTTGTFKRIIDDPAPLDRSQVKRVLLCTGKIYYELAEEQKKRNETKVAIVRLEQLYPINEHAVHATIAAYPSAREVVWVQEEPANMGAHWFLRLRLEQALGDYDYRAACRVESASPATGSQRAHVIEQQELVGRAFGPMHQLQ